MKTKIRFDITITAVQVLMLPMWATVFAKTDIGEPTKFKILTVIGLLSIVHLGLCFPAIRDCYRSGMALS